MHKDFYTKLDEWLGGFFSAEGYLSIRYPIIRKKVYLQKFLIEPKASVTQKISPINLAGFIEGDGCIGVTIMKNKRNYGMNPFVRASQNLYPQYSLLEFIQGIFEYNKYKFEYHIKKTRTRDSTSFTYRWNKKCLVVFAINLPIYDRDERSSNKNYVR